jgi:hypothetical protein
VIEGVLSLVDEIGRSRERFVDIVPSFGVVIDEDDV